MTAILANRDGLAELGREIGCKVTATLGAALRVA
jgi:hypothetical protein